MSTQATSPAIEIENLTLKLGEKSIFDKLNLIINPGETIAIVGGSGSGKSTLLRTILNLQSANSGSIKVFGQVLATLDPSKFLSLQKRWGVMFQQGALFSALTTLENIAFPLHEHTQLNHTLINQLAMLKLLAAGLPADAAAKYPAELSGGMLKRAALARAIVLDPELLFLDEPTAGLDPESAANLDQLILDLKSTLGLTIIMATHDLDSLWTVTDRVAFLAENRVLEIAPIEQLVKSEKPEIHEYFSGPRGRVAEKLYTE